jgi:hypothetical protein
MRKNDPLTQFARLRKELLEEKAHLESRLQQINEVLDVESAIPAPAATAPARPAPGPRRRGPKPRGPNSMSMREAVITALSKGPLSRQELVGAVEATGYRFTTNNPLNSIGSVLYGKNSPAENKEGKFQLKSSVDSGSTQRNGDATTSDTPRKKRRRKLTAETRAKLAAAQRARRARERAAK